MRILKAFFVSIILFFASLPLLHGQPYDYRTYWGDTTTTWTVEWDSQANVTHFELQFLNVERQLYYAKGSTQTNSFTVVLPKTGHFIAEVRACKDQLCSEWVTSALNANPPFWIYVTMPKPKNVKFE